MTRRPTLAAAALAALLVIGVAVPSPAAAAGAAEAGGEAPAAVAAAPAPAAWVPPDEELEARGAVIGEIEIRVENVFNPELPEEDRRLFRWTNRLHRTTRPEVVRSQLLFRSGEPYSVRLLRETERLLRSRKYLYDCRVRPLRYEDNTVDLEVWVKDVWTLKATGAVKRSGGENSVRFELQDSNLFGTGKSVALERSSDVDRSSVIAKYLDRNVGGSRVRLDFTYSDNSDGDLVNLAAGRPFFALDTRWAAGGFVRDDDRIDSLYRLGKVVERFRHRQERLDLGGGLSRGLVGRRARRWTFGLGYARDRFAAEPGLEAPAALPEDVTRVYPWVGFERVEDAFALTRDQDQLSRTEDVLLGTHYRGRLGFASTALGSDRDQLVFDFRADAGFEPAPGQRLRLRAGGLGRLDRGGPENLALTGEGRFYWRDFGRHLFFAQLETGFVRDLDGREQLLLGGDSGLRGYPLRYQDGEARLLVTLEQRFFTGFYPFRLFWVGAAVFFDAGRVWTDERSLSPGLGWLKDVGVGLRLSSSRSGFGTVVHFDVAFPLDGDRSIRSVQYLVTTKETL